MVAAGPDRVLGGLGEIGAQLLLPRGRRPHRRRRLRDHVPRGRHAGLDLVLPDFTYLRENADRVEGVFLTHAHEDHARWSRVPAARRVVPDLRVAVVARPRPQPHRGSRDARAHRDDPRVRRRAARDRPVRLRVHPRDALGAPRVRPTAYHTPAGTILHSGDFKLDLTPVDGRKTDLALIGEIAKRSGGIKLLLSDSTNAEKPGFTPSETTVGVSMRNVFRDFTDRRFIVACFSSHLHRVQQVTEEALNAGRKVAFLGRSMVQNVAPRAARWDSSTSRRIGSSTSKRCRGTRRARCA